MEFRAYSNSSILYIKNILICMIKLEYTKFKQLRQYKNNNYNKNYTASQCVNIYVKLYMYK